jgi:hypothetical protein
MTQIPPIGRLTRAGHVLDRKLDSIPFSPYHMMLIAVPALVGFVDGYDLVMTGSLLVLAKPPLHLSPEEIRFLAVASTMMICVGGFAHTGANGRAADHCASVDWPRGRLCGLCALSDRRRAYACAASPHTQRRP